MRTNSNANSTMLAQVMPISARVVLYSLQYFLQDKLPDKLKNRACKLNGLTTCYETRPLPQPKAC